MVRNRRKRKAPGVRVKTDDSTTVYAVAVEISGES